MGTRRQLSTSLPSFGSPKLAGASTQRQHPPLAAKVIRFLHVRMCTSNHSHPSLEICNQSSRRSNRGGVWPTFDRHLAARYRHQSKEVMIYHSILPHKCLLTGGRP